MIQHLTVAFILDRLDDVLAVSSFTNDVKDPYLQLIRELEYLKVYMLCLAKWNRSPFGKDKNFGFVEEFHIESALVGAERKYTTLKWAFQGFDVVDSELLEKIHQCKPKITEDCFNFLDCWFKCDFSIDELPEFMCSISASLRNLLELKANMIRDVKVKIESLKDNLDLLKEVFEFAAKRCSSLEDLEDFKIHTQAWACCAACLSLLYWVLDVKKENMAPRTEVILSDLPKKINPSTPEATRMHLAVLKASKPSVEDSFTVGKLVMKFVEFLKNNLQVDTENDGIQMLFIDLIFLITFLMDLPEAEKFAERKLILKEAEVAVNDVASLISSLSSDEIKEGLTGEQSFLLHTFLEKAKTIKAEVRKLYAHLFPDPSSFNFPRINVLGFIDSLLENLKEFCFHFPKHQIMMLQEELLSLKESNLKDFSILKLQNKHKDIEDLWTRIVNVAYSAERAVSSFIYMKKSLWHDILSLSGVIEEMKLIKGEMQRIKDQHMYDIHALISSESGCNPLLPSQANIPTMDKVVVGFKAEVEEILDRLISGSEELDIISIVGMPGLGKTTLAKKVYSDPSAQYHFNKRAWCTVSQTSNGKRTLLQILSHLNVCGDDLSKMEEEELAERVYRSLKGQRYLIVMDDVWNVSAWHALKMSFPEDNNGSRIIFTCRIHNVVLEAKSGCSPFPLNPLSQEESWELLEKKLFDQYSSPPDFVRIGKQIATNCKGLPLAIVLIAGLLKKKIESLDWWKQIGESLNSLIAEERCTHMLELSYKHLPEYLKPCFLYFGLFKEDEEIIVRELILLWVSEGFIQKHEIKSLEVVAEEYLMDLVARSLVIVIKRSSTGGIKACRVHDLLHDFCIAKGEEENLCKVIRGNEVSYMATSYAHYRVSNQTEWTSFLEQVPPASSIHSLFLFFPHSCVRSYPFSNFKWLRVLILESEFQLDIWLPDPELPERITELVLLRYVSILWRYNAIDYKSIPPLVKRLKNLETLRLLGSFDLPVTIWELQKLRHVHISELRIPDPGFLVSMPPLVNVQTFASVILCYGEESEMFLRKIPNVLKLGCTFKLSGDCMDYHQIVKLDFLPHLESLSIGHSESLYINTSDRLHSCAFYFPSTLKKLNLMQFELPWSDISPIMKLPNLEVLKLYGSFCGRTWNVEDEEFLKLRCLMLKSLDIEQLNASDDSFPCLERLVVSYCKNLEEIPSRFGSIATLKAIEVDDCCRSTLIRSVRQIQEDQKDLGNEHLEVLITDDEDDE